MLPLGSANGDIVSESGNLAAAVEAAATANEPMAVEPPVEPDEAAVVDKVQQLLANAPSPMGAKTIASALHGGRIADLSLAFTGVADGTCEALALVLAADDCALRRLNLTGNCIGRAGAVALAGSLGPLRSLDMGANMLMDGEASCAVAKALPASKLRTLRLAGCGVDKKACAKIAAALPRARQLSVCGFYFAC